VLASFLSAQATDACNNYRRSATGNSVTDEIHDDLRDGWMVTDVYRAYAQTRETARAGPGLV